MSIKEDFLDNHWNLKKYIRNVSVKCLQNVEDLKKSCDIMGIKFVDYSKDMFKADLILYDEVEGDEKFYFVKWRGHSSKHNSWEPASQLTASEDLLSYYTSLNNPSATLSEEMVWYFLKDLTTRKPHDILTITKLYALIYGFDEEYIISLGLNFSDLKRRVMTFCYRHKILNLGDELLHLMMFSEKRKYILSRLKEWEIEINAISPVYVKVENNSDLVGPPESFEYISNYVSSYVDLKEDPVVFCTCVDCYGNPNDCCPHNLDGTFAYNEEHYLQLPVGHPIYECNRMCKCDNNCTNRVVQHGPKVKVAIFRPRNGCGWGLKTLESVQKGQFVLEYLGEIITFEHAEDRGEVYSHLGRTYLFDMGWEDNCKYTIDAMLFGNASHFINHSCDPNLETFSVWINQQDPMLPRVAFFAKKNINPGEELTFDYKLMNSPRKHDVHGPGSEGIPCKCSAKNCKRYLF